MVTFLVDAVLGKKFNDRDEATQAAEEFLNFCAGRAWVLTDMGSNLLEPQYGFVHRTFLEYFAASQLVKEDPHPKAVWSKIRPNLRTGSWDVVSQLAIQILDGSHQNGADEILRLALHDLGRWSDAGGQCALLTFGARCLNVVAPDTSTLKQLVYQIVESACRVPARWRRISGAHDPVAVADQPLQYLLTVHAPENWRRIAIALQESLIDLLKDSRSDSSSGIVYYFLSRPDEFMRYHPVGASLPDLLGEVDAPKVAIEWQSLLDSPTAQNMQDRGLQVLYEPTFCIGFSLSCHAVDVLEKIVSISSVSQLTAVGGRLESWYPSLCDGDFGGVGILACASEWQRILARVNCRMLHRLEPVARAAVLLLLLPVFKVMGDEVEDLHLRNLATARDVPVRRDAAVDLINELCLPEAAHRRIIEWIHGR